MSGGMSYFDGKQAPELHPADGLPNPYIKRVFEAKNGDVYLIDGLNGWNLCGRENGGAIHTFRHARGHGRRHSRRRCVGGKQFIPGQPNPVRPVFFQGRSGRPHSSGFTTWPPGGMVPSGSPPSMEFFRVKDGTCQQWSVPEGLSWYNVHWIF